MTRLRQRYIEDLQLHGLAASSQEVYVRAVNRLAKYYGRSPEDISDEELRQYFLYLKNEKRAARSTCTLAICSIKLLYERTLKRPWPTLYQVRPAKEQKLPVVLSREEVQRILECLTSTHQRTCLSTIYSCGLRTSEGVSLKVGDIDSSRMVLHVHQGKGNKERYVPLPEQTLALLRSCWLSHQHPVWLFPSRIESPDPAQATQPMSSDGTRKAFRLALQASGCPQASNRAVITPFIRPPTYWKRG